MMKTVTRPIFIMLSFLTVFLLQTNAQEFNKKEPQIAGITAFSSTADGRRYAMGNSSSIEIIDTEKDSRIYNMTLTSGVSCMCLREDGNAIFVALNNQNTGGNLFYWDFQSGSRIPIFHDHTDKILCLAISPDGNLIASGSKDNSIKIFETKGFREIRTITSPRSKHVTALRFSPDSKSLLSGNKDKIAILWDMENSNNAVSFKGNSRKINDVAFSPDGKLIATAGDDMIIRIWEKNNSQEPIYMLQGHSSSITSIDFTSDGRFIGSASKDRTIRVWDYKNSNELSLRNKIGMYLDEPVNHIAFYEGGKLFTVNGGRSVYYWNWGFPILSIEDIKIDDSNKNNIIEGTEDVKIRFNIVNSGDGNALNLNFNITETQKMEGLTYPNSFFIASIPARTTHSVEVRITSSEKLKNGRAILYINDLKMMTYSPYKTKDTSIVLQTMASPHLEIENIVFEYPDSTMTLAGNRSGIFNIYLKNSGSGMAKNVQVNISCDKAATMIEFPESINVGNIGSAMTQIVKIPVKASKKSNDGVINFRFAIDESSGISHPLGNHFIEASKYVSSLTEEIRIAVEGKIISWQAKSKWETSDEYKARVNERTRDLKIAAFTQQTIDSLVKENFHWSNAVTDMMQITNHLKLIFQDLIPFFYRSQEQKPLHLKHGSNSTRLRICPIL